MGWWSCTIMGGDTPLDARDTIMFDVLELDSDKFFDDEYKFEDIQKLMLDNIERIRYTVPQYDWYEEIWDQVMGVLVMEYGMPTDNEHVEALLERAKEAAAADEWATDDAERRMYIGNFHETLEAYDGTPTTVKSEGLFEKIAEHITEGGSGLVNKNI